MTLLTVEKISPVPAHLFSKILRETSAWDLQEKKYENFDPAFKKHYVKGFKISSISRSKNTNIPEFLLEVIEWIQQIANCKDHSPVQAMLNVIMPGQQFPIHIDSLYLHRIAKRYHICLDNSLIDYYFFINDKIIHRTMDKGFLYFYNNRIPHGVKNTSSLPRTNLIIDMIPNNICLDKSLMMTVPEVADQWKELKKNFQSDNQLLEFTKDSIF